MNSVLKRTLALLLALALACSLLCVSASAASYCQHTSYTVTQETPATCTNGGSYVGICNLCGNHIDGGIPALGHSYSNHVAEHASCSNDGWGQYVCDRCGDISGTYTLPKLGHDLYDAEVTATCTTGGVITHKCRRCIYQRNETVGPLGHDMGPYVIVKEATETEPGLKRSECSRCDHADEIPYSLTAEPEPEPCDGKDPDSGKQLIVRKYDVTPGNPVYAPGDLVTFSIVGTNTGDTEAVNVVLTDLDTGDTATYASLPPGASCWLTATYTVTPYAADVGCYCNEASITGMDSVTGESLINFTQCEVLCGEKTPPFSLTKEEISSPFHSEGYIEGENVWYRLTVTNLGETVLSDVVLDDALCGVSLTLPPIAPHDSNVQIVNHWVTHQEVIDGTVHNVAWAEAGGTRLSAVNDVRTYPSDGKATGVFLTKYVVNTPTNGFRFTEGEEIRFAITLVNNSDLPVRHYTIEDDMDSSATWSGFNLGAFDFVTVPYSHITTHDDVVNGYYLNSAHAMLTQARPEQDGLDLFIRSNLERAECGTGVLVEGDDCCVRTMTAAGESGAEYRQDFCGEHSSTRTRASELLSGSSSETELLGAYTEIAALWQEDLNGLYAEWTAAVSDNMVLRRMVDMEKSSFCDMMEAFEASLNTWNADHPADNARMIAELLERKVVTLCYELHTQDPVRPDLETAAGRTQMSSADAASCSRTWSEEDANTFLCTDLLCAVHRKIASSARTYLDHADTELKQYSGWITMRTAWENALSGSTIPLMKDLSPEEKEIVAGVMEAVRSYTSARYDFLEFLYGTGSPAAAEVSAREMQELVILQCGLMK